MDFSRLTPDDYTRHMNNQFTPEEKAYCDNLIADIDNFAAYLVGFYAAQTYETKNLDVARAIVFLQDKMDLDSMCLDRIALLQKGHHLAMAVSFCGGDHMRTLAGKWVDDANLIAYPMVNRAFAMDRIQYGSSNG